MKAINSLPKRYLMISAVFLLSAGLYALADRTSTAGQTTQCSRKTVEELLSSSSQTPSEYILNCSVTLPKASTITKNIVFEGSAASGSVLDCNQSAIDASGGRSTLERIAIIVRSKQREDGSWDAPRGITIKDCTIKGFIRVRGLDYTAGGPNMKASSVNSNHTEFAQASAPQDITFEDLKVFPPGNIALYIGPGVRRATLTNSRLNGNSRGTAIYLDAESADNVISNNVFTIKTTGRELIAIDGSARNRIIGNVFENPVNGGIFIYRNCGEGGVIRHQKPEGNVISDNVFRYASAALKPAVWLGSRQGEQPYCFSDSNHVFGSSESPLDFARHNTVELNKLIGGAPSLIRNSDEANVVRDNSPF